LANTTFNKNKWTLLILVGTVLVVFFVLRFLILNKTIASKNYYNPYFKELPIKYSAQLKKATSIKDGYSAIIVNDNLTPKLLVFKEQMTVDEKETDLTLTLFYNTYNNTANKKEFELEYTNRAVFYTNNEKNIGVFTIDLPQVAIDEIKISLHKYRRAKAWEVTIKNNQENTIIPLSINNDDDTNQKLPNPYRYHFTKTLSNLGIKSLPYSYTIKGDSLFQSTKKIQSYISQNKATVLTINKPKLFWNSVNNKTETLANFTIEGVDKNLISKNIASFKSNQKLLSEVFDISKLAHYEALRNVFTNGCLEKQYFIYNTNTSLLEPFFVNSNCLGKRTKIVNKPLLLADDFIANYISIIDSITKVPVKEIGDHKFFKQELALINSYYPLFIYKKSVLEINKNLLKNSLYPATNLITEFISINKKTLKVSIRNVAYFPLQITGLDYKSKKHITTLNSPETIKPGEEIVVEIPLPRSFENLFVHKKTKETGFRFPKDVYDLRILFSTVGTDIVQKTTIIPYKQKEEVQEDLFRIKPDIFKNPWVTVDKETKEIILLDSVSINKPMVIPSGYVLKAKEGTIINIIKGGKIVSNSPIAFKGTKEHPIKIYSSDKKGQGMIVLAEGENSHLSYVNFNNLTNPSHGDWMVTGAVTFYESPVNLDHVTINKNRSEDALNIVRTHFFMTHCTISNTQSDAFDGDFVTGTIKDSYFTNLGNDAIDVSGSDITIKNVTINSAKDKGLSAGENSKMTIENVTITNSEIAIAGKDLSKVVGKKLTIKNNKLAFTAFKKKSEFGPSHITVSEVSLEEVELDYLVETGSSLLLNGKKAKTITNVKSKMYGVEFGRSSKETRGN